MSQMREEAGSSMQDFASEHGSAPPSANPQEPNVPPDRGEAASSTPDVSSRMKDAGRADWRNWASSINLIGALVLAAAVGVGLRSYMNGMDRNVSNEIPSLADGSDRVTAISWEPGLPTTLVAGTQLGRLYRIDGSSGPQLMTENADGPVVTINPVPSDGTGDAGTHTIWLDPTFGSGTPFRGETVQSFAEQSQDGPTPPPERLPVPQPPSADMQGKKFVASRRPIVVQQATASPDANPVTAVGFLTIAETSQDRSGRPFDDVTLVGHRDGSLRLINSKDQSLLSALRSNDGNPSAASPPASRSVVAITTRRDQRKLQTTPELRSNSGALFAVALANGDVRVIRASLSGGAPRLEQIRMVNDGPFTGPAAGLGDRLPVSVRPDKDGLLLSEDGNTLMIHGYGGVALANLAESTGSDASRTFRRFMPDALAINRAPVQRPDVLRLQQALLANEFNPGPPDGLMGTATRQALSAYKTARSIAGDAEAFCSLRLDCPGLRISTAALSPRGDFFALAGNDHIIRIVMVPNDLRTLSGAEQFEVRGHADVITQMAISNDGADLASIDINGRLFITNIGRAKQAARWLRYDIPAGPPTTEMMPVPLAETTLLSPRPNDLIVALGPGASLDAARSDVARATAAGFTNVGIYQINDKSIGIARFPDEQTQHAALLRLRALPTLSRRAYPTSFSEMCPSQPQQLSGGVVRCNNAKAATAN